MPTQISAIHRPQSLGVLAYQSRPDLRILPPAYRDPNFKLVLVLWLLPMLAGATIFLIYEIARASGTSSDNLRDILEGLGGLTLIIGTLFAGAGLLAVFSFVMRRMHDTVNVWTEVVAPALGLLALLGSNCVIALGFLLTFLS